MHCRIFQLKTERITDNNCHELVKADDFAENSSFMGPIADYASDDCDRRDDCDWLVKTLQNTLGADHEKYLAWYYAGGNIENIATDIDMPEGIYHLQARFQKGIHAKAI